MSEIITESNRTVSQEDNSTQNDYIIAINKKIRAQKKKCQNIAYIEQRLANKETINNDQKKVVDSKDQTVRMLKELESLRDQFVEIYNAEEKKKAAEKKPASPTPAAPASPAPASVALPDQSVIESKIHDTVRDLITLFHTTQVFDRTRPEGAEARQKLFAEIAGQSQLIKGDEDIDNIYYLLSLLFTNGVKNATAVSLKFLSALEEEWDAGVTYKQLKAVVYELAASKTFLSHPAQASAEPAQPEPAQPQQEAAPVQQEEPQVVPQTEAPVEAKQPQPEEVQKPQEQPQEPEETAPEGVQQQDSSKDDEGYTTKEGRFSRGRGRGRGTRGGSFRGSPRGGRRDFDGNRGGRSGSYENKSPREFSDRPRGGGRGGGRGDFDGNRGGRGQYQQPQQPRA